MKISDTQKIRILMEMGYKVVVKDLKGKDFSCRYEVYHIAGFDNLVKVIIDKDGNIKGI